MEFGSLRTFVAVADSGSFSAAAQQLYLTQPAVSKRLAALEAELNIRLFDRIGRNVRLTHAGEELLPKAREILLQAQDMKHLASNLQT
ncbi:LysR family transcriptional regulator, partial [Thiolapillus sp.]